MTTTEQRRENVPDRRVRRTRKLLHDAFISLVIEKGYEKTTIQDILDRADVGRSTFYVHYRDKEALLTANFDAMQEQLECELDQIAATGPFDVALPAALLFEHAYRNQRVYRAMCGIVLRNVSKLEDALHCKLNVTSVDRRVTKHRLKSVPPGADQLRWHRLQPV